MRAGKQRDEGKILIQRTICKRYLTINSINVDDNPMVYLTSYHRIYENRYSPRGREISP